MLSNLCSVSILRDKKGYTCDVKCEARAKSRNVYFGEHLKVHVFFLNYIRFLCVGIEGSNNFCLCIYQK